MQPRRESSHQSDTNPPSAIRTRPLEQLRSLGSRSSSRGKTTAALLLGHKSVKPPSIDSISRSCPGSRTTSKTRRQNEFNFDNPNLQWVEGSAKQQNDGSNEETDQQYDPPAYRDDHHDEDDDDDDDDQFNQVAHGRRRSLHMSALPQQIQQQQQQKRKQQQQDDEESSSGEEGDGDEKRKIKHIHPCVCDIGKKRWRAIRNHLKEKQLAQAKFESRLRQIEEEFRLAEEAELARRRQIEEDQELYGDEYEQAGKHRVRKKRSARRASMVSLGVKQVINWRKAPKIMVKYNRTSALRKENPTYCRRSFSEMSIRAIKWHDQPKISIRTTKTVTLRSLEIKKKMEKLEKEKPFVKYPKRPPFTLVSFVV